jgi:hypothetical protein
MIKNIIVFLCSDSEVIRERLGYTKAFVSIGFRIIYCENEITLLPNLEKYQSQILAVIHPEPYQPFHSLNIWNYHIPNIIFQWDTFTILQKRIAASKPYDIQIICHPRFKKSFNDAYCRNVLVLPWCFDDSISVHEKSDVKKIKFDIGWIGRSDAKFYKKRRIILNKILQSGYKLNDVEKKYSWTEMFEVFQLSKIVINVSRDDYPEDANMRCFEAMGCGALLLTQKNTELEELGLYAGKHFITYQNDDDLIKKVEYYLQNDDERNSIAINGRKEVLINHTYKKRVEELVNFINQNSNEVIQQNFFRKLTLPNKYFFLGFSFIKDINIVMLKKCVQKTSFTNKCILSIHLFVLLVKHFKQKIL